MSISGEKLVGEALALFREGKLKEGIECLKRATEIQPDLVEAWGHLSGALMLAGRHEDALHSLEQVLRLDPHNLEARWRMADRLVRLNRLEEAEAQYRAALEQEPASHDARCGLKYTEWLRKRRRVAEGRPKGTRDEKKEDQTVSGTEPDNRAVDRQKDENERRAREHFERADRRLTSLAAHLHIESTTRCNAACVMCTRGHHPYYAIDLQPQAFKRIEKDLLPIAVSVNFSGLGEPMLARRFDQFYDAAVRCRTQVYFVTNATALSIARLERFARQKTHMVASIDGATRETFEAIRGRLQFDRVIEGLRLYKKVRDLFPEAGSTLMINFVAMRRNIEELPALVDLAADLAAHAVCVLHPDITGLSGEMVAEQLFHYPDRANRFFDEAAERARQYGITIQLPPKFITASTPTATSRFEWLRRMGRLLPQRRRFPQRCFPPWMSVYISAGGLVHPCCASQRVMGNLNLQSAAEIWNGRRYRRFRRRISSFLPPIECRNCCVPPGINAGNRSVVIAREGLLVELFYRAEAYWPRLAGRMRRLLYPLVPLPEPNYAAGRPIRPTPPAHR